MPHHPPPTNSPGCSASCGCAWSNAATSIDRTRPSRHPTAARDLDRLRAENAELLPHLDDHDQAAAGKAPRGPEFDLVIFDETADFRPDSPSDAPDPAVVLEPLDDAPAPRPGWRRW